MVVVIVILDDRQERDILRIQSTESPRTCIIQINRERRYLDIEGIEHRELCIVFT